MDWWQAKYKPGLAFTPPVSCFRPKSTDHDGLSVSQSRLSTIEQASTTAKGKRACLGAFPTGVATSRGLTIELKPTVLDPGHSVIPQMSSVAHGDSNTRDIVDEHARALADASTIVYPDSTVAAPGV
jgi:hypothetical protein